MIKSIFFDFDNTLADFSGTRKYYLPALEKFVEKKYKKKGFAKAFDDVDIMLTMKARDTNSPKLYNRTLWAEEAGKKLGVNFTNKEAKEIHDLFWRILIQKMKLFSETKQILKKLKKRYSLFIISDGDGERAGFKKARVSTFGILDLFKGYAFGDSLHVTKPNPKFFRTVLKKYRLNPSECVMIGDRPASDLINAKKLGIKTIWYDYGHWAEREHDGKIPYVDYRITKLAQIPKMIEKL